MKRYLPAEFETKWQDDWQKTKLYQAVTGSNKPKKYILDMFPYPSGDGIHVGHTKVYTASDILARYFRAKGFNVLHPMGWDAFGLPAENYAIKTGIHPKLTTAQNISNIKAQMQAVGYSYDWSKEINTTDENYYKWTQWIFLKLYEKGLAYEAEAPINWCPKDLTGLANEEVINGHCERCGTQVERREIRQWILKITNYADQLLADLEGLDWPDAIKEMQINWIGKSQGSRVKFGVDQKDYQIEIFTTRVDTIFGVSALVIAPEHPQVEDLTTDEHRQKVGDYLNQVSKKSDLERTELSKDKTGVFTGSYAINPVNNQKVPIWIADYVLGYYGTGAVMFVPAHDERDYQFAKKYDLPVTTVIEPVSGTERPNEEFRQSIVALVHDPKENKILSINWGDQLGGSLLIGGGVEAGEDIVAAAQREVTEETGYQNLKLISQSETIHHHYFAASKNVARFIDAKILYFELIDSTQIEANLSADEAGKFKVEWLSISEANNQIKDSLHKYAIDKFINQIPYTGDGILTNSGEFNGLTSEESREAITKSLKKSGLADFQTQYKLRDWIFSRQRYWGEPIPVVHCPKDGIVPVPEDQLPIKLPDIANYQPTGNGESPLAAVEDWVNTTCPKCDGPAKRETNTMPQWAGSCWYYLRFINPENMKQLVDPAEEAYWMNIDWYLGGAEHAVLHLLYARFWHKVLYEAGVVSTKEPFQKLSSVGLVLAADGQKMSKSKGNVVRPDAIIKEYGADTLRVYEAFMGPFENAIAWDPTSINGVYRFLFRIWEVLNRPAIKETNSGIEAALQKSISKVGKDIESLKLNTAIASLMEFINTVFHQDLTSSQQQRLLVILAPFAPHLASEIWSNLGFEGSVHQQLWPEVNNDLLVETEYKIVIQINGKPRDVLTVPTSITETELTVLAKKSTKVAKYIEDHKIIKSIYVPGKILSLVVG